MFYNKSILVIQYKNFEVYRKKLCESLLIVRTNKPRFPFQSPKSNLLL